MICHIESSKFESVSMNKEIWEDIEGYEGLYQVSNLGRIKSLRRRRKIGRGATQPMPERILKQNSAKYRMVTLSKDGIVEGRNVHRIVLITFAGKAPNKYETNHIDGNKHNNCLSNLEWVSSSENTLHSYRLGLQKKRRPQRRVTQ